MRLLQKNYFSGFASFSNSSLNLEIRYLQIINECDVNYINIETNIKQLNKRTHEAFDIISKDINSETTQLPFRVLSTDCIKICPKCLTEQKYWRTLWDLKVYIACPKHNLLLVSQCTACKKKIYPFHIPIGFCSCGFDLSTSLEIPSSDVCSNFSKLLEGKCFEEGKGLSTVNSFGPLNKLSLIEIIILCKSFSVTIGNSVFGKWTSFSENEDKTMVDTLEYTFNIFTSWPKNYHLFLDNLAELKRSKKPSAGISSLFGVIYKNLNCISQDFIQTETENYLIKNWEKGYFKKMKGSNFSELYNNFIGIEEASREMNVFPKKLLNLVESGVINGKVIQGNKRKIVLIKRDSLLTYKLFSEQILTFGNARKLLGLSKLNMHHLLKSNLLDAKKIYSSGIGNWNIMMRDVLAILDIFEESCVEITNYTEVLGFTKAVQLVAQWGFDVTLIIILVQQSKLVPRIINKGQGLHQYYFIKREIERTVLEFRSDKFLLQKDVAELLDVAPVSVGFWIKKGILTCDIPYGKRGFGIHPTTFREFNEKYMTLREILKFFPFHTFNTIVDYLINIPLTPIAGLKVDGNAGYLFLRADIMKLINQNS